MTTRVQNIEVKTQSKNIKIDEISHDKEIWWDKFIESHPTGTMYHLIGWKHVLEKTFGYKPHYLAAFNSVGEIVGVLPMFLMYDIFRKKYLVSNPFSNFAGLCTHDSQAGRQLLETAFQIARDEKAQYVEFRQLGNPLDGEVLAQPLSSKESFVTLMLPINSDSQLMWRSISSRNRGKIRNAEKAGLKVDLGMRYLKDFYEILARNLRHLGTPIHPYSFFEAIADVFPNRVDILVLKLDSVVVSAMFLFRFKNILAEPWVSSLRQYHKIYVNNLLYWRAIEYACENNFEIFDFGRSTISSGTFNFKIQWGARPVQLYYQYFLNRAKKIPMVDAIDNQYERYIKIWKRLPLKVTQMLGPRLVKYVPQL